MGILFTVFIVFIIWQSCYNYDRCKKIKNECERMRSANNKLNEDYARLQKEYSVLERKYECYKDDKFNNVTTSTHNNNNISYDDYDRQLWKKVNDELYNKLPVEKIQENSDVFVYWDVVGDLYNLKVKDTSFRDVEYGIKCNYVNKGWKIPELIRANTQCCSVKIGDAYVVFYAPTKGIVTYTEKSSYQKGDIILSIESNDAKIADFEKQILKEKLLEKKRKQDIEKAALQELMDEGEIFPEANKRPPIPKEVVDAVWNRDGGKCVYCGSTENLHLDHIIPFSKGGDTSVENLQLLCQKCNLQKSNKIG